MVRDKYFISKKISVSTKTSITWQYFEKTVTKTTLEIVCETPITEKFPNLTSFLKFNYYSNTENPNFFASNKPCNTSKLPRKSPSMWKNKLPNLTLLQRKPINITPLKAKMKQRSCSPAIIDSFACNFFKLNRFFILHYLPPIRACLLRYIYYWSWSVLEEEKNKYVAPGNVHQRTT